MYSQADYLSVLCQVSAETVKPFTDSLIPQLGPIEVLKNRTGLIMLPYTDSVQGTAFHLGEVLVAEAHVRVAHSDGYAAVMGRDLEQALAVAILDGALQSGQQIDVIEQFVNEQAQHQEEKQEHLLRQVEATRVEMETF